MKATLKKLQLNSIKKLNKKEKIGMLVFKTILMISKEIGKELIIKII